MTGQSRIHSALESFLNVAIGFGVALLGQWLIFPLFGIAVSVSENLMIGALFTAISIIRSYVVRRVFNAWHVRGAKV